MNKVESKRLRELLDYEPETGLFRWRSNRTSRVRAGSIAGTINKKDGRRRIGIDGTKYLASRLAWLFVHDEWPDEVDIDHKDLDRSNDIILNLRRATRSQNNANKRISSKNTSGRKGVRWHRQGRWQAYIKSHGRQRHLGLFDDLEEAATAYNNAAIETWGEFARSD